MYFIITGTSQHFGRLIINVDQNNIGFFHQGRYSNIRKKQQNEKSELGIIFERCTQQNYRVVLVDFKPDKHDIGTTIRNSDRTRLSQQIDSYSTRTDVK